MSLLSLVRLVDHVKEISPGLNFPGLEPGVLGELCHVQRRLRDAGEVDHKACSKDQPNGTSGR